VTPLPERPWRAYRPTVMRRVPALAVAAALAAGGCTGDDRPSADRPAPATTPATVAATPREPVVGEALLRYEWRLLTYAMPGRPPVRVADGYTVNVVDGGSRLIGQACNRMEGPVTVGDGTLDVGETFSTLKGCTGEDRAVDTAFSRVVAEQRVAWSVAGGRLRLTAPDGTTLRFEAIGGEYPGGRPRTLTSGTHEGWRYRLYAEPAPYGVKVGWVGRDPAGRPVRGAADGWDSSLGSTVAPVHLGVVASPLGDARILGGLVPRGTVRVVYRPGDGGAAVTVRTYDVPGAPPEAYLLVVPRNPPGSTAAAYDRDGRVLARWTRP